MRAARRSAPEQAALEAVSDDLIVHELCHVWQAQHEHARMWLTYLYLGYRHNPYEVMARGAVRGE